MGSLSPDSHDAGPCNIREARKADPANPIECGIETLTRDKETIAAFPKNGKCLSMKQLRDIYRQ